MELLIDAIQELARCRAEKDHAKKVLEEIDQSVELVLKYAGLSRRLTMAKELLQVCREGEATATDLVRQLRMELFDQTGDKAPFLGTKIQRNVQVELDTEKAIEYAVEAGADPDGLDDIITLVEGFKVLIDSDLSEYK